MHKTWSYRSIGVAAVIVLVAVVVTIVLAGPSGAPAPRAGGASQPTPAPRPHLTAVMTGEPGTIVLEWAWDYSSADVTWEYRKRRYHPSHEWGGWTPVTGGSLRVSDLPAGTGYRFEVRAVRPGLAPVSSGTAVAFTIPWSGCPRLHSFLVAEGDGETKWQLGALDLFITIPGGMRLVGGDAYMGSRIEGEETISLWDAASGSALHLSQYTGEELGRTIEGSGRRARTVDVLFDQIVSSVEYARGPMTTWTRANCP